jgi:folate-dependent phosphoribosylglycinamide formyltransferase PurN
MSNYNREAYVSADISELWAGYNVHLTTTYKDGTIIQEKSIPCRTKEDAEEIAEKFLNGEYNAES